MYSGIPDLKPIFLKKNAWILNKKLRFYFILHVFFISDTKFSTKICQSGAIKAIYPILKHLSGKAGNLYPVLQVRTFVYLFELIEHPIRRDPNFNFPNFKVFQSVFFFFNTTSDIGIFGCTVELVNKELFGCPRIVP